MKEDKIERVKNEVEFKSARGYRSNFTRIREQVLRNRAQAIASELDYESVEVE